VALVVVVRVMRGKTTAPLAGVLVEVVRVMRGKTTAPLLAGVVARVVTRVDRIQNRMNSKHSTLRTSLRGPC
jgi:hypothetical protein